MWCVLWDVEEKGVGNIDGEGVEVGDCGEGDMGEWCGLG